MIRWFIAVQFARHCAGLHDADFEVCPRPLCRLAHWLERAIRLQVRP
jgi:hypothetical protein